ncbi:myeloid leukemia factor 1-like [Glandiceps talaboti]
MLGDFEDPFFSDFGDRHRDFDRMMEQFDRALGAPFHHGGLRSLTDSRQRALTDGQEGRRPIGKKDSGAMQEFGSFDDGFSSMSAVMEDFHKGQRSMMESMTRHMGNMMDSVHRDSIGLSSDPSAHSYRQTSVTHYSKSDKDESPKYYQATSSVKTAPGGIKETKKALRDSTTGTEKMAVGHHIGERGHVMERSRNRYSGEEKEHQEYLNMDEKEAPTFDQDWRDKTSKYFPSSRAVGGRDYDRHATRYDRHRTRGRDRLAIESKKY